MEVTKESQSDVEVEMAEQGVRRDLDLALDFPEQVDLREHYWELFDQSLYRDASEVWREGFRRYGDGWL